MQNDNKQASIELAQANTDPGFKVPGAAGTPAAKAAASASAPAPTIEVQPVAGAPATDTSARELAIGGAIFMVLLVVFFFARNAFTHHLVVRRVAPSAAGSAGWLLFLGLAFLSAAAVLAIINASKFLTLAITGPLLLVGAASLIGALLVGRR